MAQRKELKAKTVRRSKSIAEKENKKTNAKIHITELTSQEQLTVFRQLLKEPAIRRKADLAAAEFLSEVNADEVATDVIQELGNLDPDELARNSGRTRDGYVDIYELSWSMFHDAVQPFTKELSRLLKHGLSRQAKLYCMGVLKGMKRYEHEGDEFSEWIPDAASGYSEEVYNLWKKDAEETEIAEMDEFRQSLDDAD